MTARRDLAQSVYDADKAIDKLSEELAGALRKAVTANTDGDRITQDQRRAILRDVDRALDAVYPKRRGEPSAMQTLIERACYAAAAKPVNAAVAEMRKNVDDDLWGRMNGDR